MPQQIRAVVVDPAAPGKLTIRGVELRDPDRDEVAVRVSAISLNRGETRRALQVAEPGWRPGWDFAGVVDTAAFRMSRLLPSSLTRKSAAVRSGTATPLPSRTVT